MKVDIKKQWIENTKNSGIVFEIIHVDSREMKWEIEKSHNILQFSQQDLHYVPKNDYSPEYNKKPFAILVPTPEYFIHDNESLYSSPIVEFDFDDEVIAKFDNANIDWKFMSSSYNFTIDQIEKYKDQIIWDYMWNVFSLNFKSRVPLEILEKYSTKVVNWSDVYTHYNGNIPVEILEKNYTNLDLNSILDICPSIPDSFIKKHITGFPNLYKVMFYQNSSEDTKRLAKKLISKNEKNMVMHKTIVYSNPYTINMVGRDQFLFYSKEPINEEGIVTKRPDRYNNMGIIDGKEGIIVPDSGNAIHCIKVTNKNNVYYISINIQDLIWKGYSPTPGSKFHKLHIKLDDPASKTLDKNNIDGVPFILKNKSVNGRMERKMIWSEEDFWSEVEI